MRNILLILACIVILPSALAFDESDVGVWDNVYLTQDVAIPITVENNSVSDKELEVEFIGPSALFYEFMDVPSEVKASQSVEFGLYLSPSIEMEGTAYTGTLIVKLGDETALKEIKLHVSKIIPEPTQSPDGNGGDGFFPFGFLGSIEAIITYFLLAIVTVLALFFVAKLWSTRKRKRGELFE